MFDDDKGRAARSQAEAVKVGTLADIIDARRNSQGLEVGSFTDAPGRLRGRRRRQGTEERSELRLKRRQPASSIVTLQSIPARVADRPPAIRPGSLANRIPSGVLPSAS